MSEVRSKSTLDSVLTQLVRELSNLHVFSQRRLAIAAGVPRSVITHWLSGRRSITLTTASKIAAVIGLSPIGEALVAADSDEGRKRAEQLQHVIRFNARLFPCGPAIDPILIGGDRDVSSKDSALQEGGDDHEV